MRRQSGGGTTLSAAGVGVAASGCFYKAIAVSVVTWMANHMSPLQGPDDEGNLLASTMAML